VLGVLAVAAALLVVHRMRSSASQRAQSSRHPAAAVPRAGRERGAPAGGGPAVAVATCTFVDHSRSTENYLTGVSTPGRRLVTSIYYPSGSSRHGPYPTVFFGNGYGVAPTDYGPLLSSWARAGLVVVAPMFPDASPAAVASVGGIGHDNDEADIPNQPGDVAFVTRTVLAASAGAPEGCPVLRGLVDPGELGLAGQSDGATTVAMLAFDQGTLPGTTTTYRSLAPGIDYRAVAVLSGEAYGDDPYAATSSSPPVLVVQSATDHCNPPEEAVDLYDALDEPDRWFLAIRDADHLTPYEGQDKPAFAVVSTVTATFLRDELRGVDPAAALARVGNADPSVATLVQGPDTPSYMNVLLPQSAAACYQT
jgi:predicted dienelactone hydrolase